MSLARTVAHFVTHRRPVVFGVVALLLAGCALVVCFGLRFNSDILDLLPKDFDSVQAFKIKDREFTDARQIVVDMQGNNPGANPLRAMLSRYGG